VSIEQQSETILRGLHEAGIDFIVVGGMAAVMLNAPIITEDLDIVHKRTPENVARLLEWLLGHGAYHRFDLAKRRLPPKEDALLGHGHLNLQIDLGKLDVLCELGEGEGYEEIFADTVVVDNGVFRLQVLGLPRLIAVKARAGRPKDRAVLPVLVATLDEQRRAKG
jgi:predicted nucleotidyltransferase